MQPRTGALGAQPPALPQPGGVGTERERSGRLEPAVPELSLPGGEEAGVIELEGWVGSQAAGRWCCQALGEKQLCVSGEASTSEAVEA